jgi:hypothetical protein
VTAAVGVRKRAADVVEDDGEIGLSLLAGHFGLQPADGGQPVVAAAVRDLWIGMQRSVDSMAHAEWITKPRRHNADAGIRMAVEFEGSADDAGLAVEVGLPHVVAEHGHVVFAGLVFARAVGAAEDGRDAEDIEEIVRSLDPLQRNRTGGRLEIDALIRRDARDSGEDVVLRAEVFETGQGERLGVALARERLRDVDAIRLTIRQRAQDHRINDAEDGGGCADAERQSQNRNQSESGRFAQLAKGVANILEDRFHGSLRGEWS